VSGVLIEAPPLVDSEEYRRLLHDLMDVRTKTLGFLSSCLHEFYQSKRVVTVRWYDPNLEHDMNHNVRFQFKYQKPRFTDTEIKNEFIRQKKR